MNNSDIQINGRGSAGGQRSYHASLPPASAAAEERLDILRNAAVARSIGQTPLVRLLRTERWLGLPGEIELYLKCEWTNPGGSIKDRTALSILRSAFIDGKLGAGQTLIDATSGNTGIAYALLGAALEIPVTLVVPASASDERKRTLEAYGANVIFSDPYEGSDGAIRLVREMVGSGGSGLFYADQYNNPANVAAHVTTTGPEIWQQSKHRVTHFVAALGTTGTLMGVGKFLRSQGDVHLIAVQPAEAFHGIEGLKHIPTAIVPGIYDPSLADEIYGVDTEEAFDAARALARLEGYFAGSSTGANLAASIRLATTIADTGAPARIVTIGCDTGSRYLSTGLWTGK
jgi:cysteine synthase B